MPTSTEARTRIPPPLAGVDGGGDIPPVITGLAQEGDDRQDPKFYAAYSYLFDLAKGTSSEEYMQELTADDMRDYIERFGRYATNVWKIRQIFTNPVIDTKVPAYTPFSFDRNVTQYTLNKLIASRRLGRNPTPDTQLHGSEIYEKVLIGRELEISPKFLNNMDPSLLLDGMIKGKVGLYSRGESHPAEEASA